MAIGKRSRFVPKNIKKYTGKYPIIFRSSWELKFARFLDFNVNIIEWNYEAIRIPYVFMGKQRNYIPDFYLTYKDSCDKIHREIIEVKPHVETVVPKKRGRNKKRYDYLSRVILMNQAKWQSAKIFCEKRGYDFKILTEKHLRI